uniref:Phosphatidylethanolamine binding protein 4 n=1 Tax=Monodelphis domestica TaxID=13616 RepID=A0A5F8GDR6_MONDO
MGWLCNLRTWVQIPSVPSQGREDVRFSASQPTLSAGSRPGAALRKKQGGGRASPYGRGAPKSCGLPGSRGEGRAGWMGAPAVKLAVMVGRSQPSVETEGTDLKTGKISGNELTSYHGPTPPPETGFHRYQFILFEESDKGKPVTLTSKENARRDSWSIGSFIKHFHLGPVAASQFMTQNYNDF